MIINEFQYNYFKHILKKLDVFNILIIKKINLKIIFNRYKCP